VTTYVATINYTTHAPPWGRLSNALSPVGANMYSDYFSESTTTPAATDIGSPATQILSRDFLQAKAQACGAQPRKMPCEEPRKKNCPAKIQSWTPKFLSARFGNFCPAMLLLKYLIQMLLKVFQSYHGWAKIAEASWEEFESPTLDFLRGNCFLQGSSRLPSKSLEWNLFFFGCLPPHS